MGNDYGNEVASICRQEDSEESEGVGGEVNCRHEYVQVNIRVMGWEQYTWTPKDGLEWADAAGKSEVVPKSGKCIECGSRVYRNFERNE